MNIPNIDPSQPTQAEIEEMMVNKAKLQLACNIVQSSVQGTGMPSVSPGNLAEFAIKTADLVIGYFHAQTKKGLIN